MTKVPVNAKADVPLRPSSGGDSQSGKTGYRWNGAAEPDLDRQGDPHYDTMIAQLTGPGIWRTDCIRVSCT
jgi:hypothetical protein